jgi:hypothetical protein
MLMPIPYLSGFPKRTRYARNAAHAGGYSVLPANANAVQGNKDHVYHAVSNPMVSCPSHSIPSKPFHSTHPTIQSSFPTILLIFLTISSILYGLPITSSC